jgi:dephospho-CoA kinase
MMIVGLTGSIGMGKTTAAQYLASKGIPVFDSDAAVHELYQGEAVPLIAGAFPDAVRDGGVDRERLSRALSAEPGAMQRLEAIVHPLVRAAQKRFLLEHAARGAPLVVFDIPLLFETGADALMDATIVVSAPPEVQKARVLARPGMTEDKLKLLLSRQMSDAQKRARADFVVETGGPIEETRLALDRIVADLGTRIGSAQARWTSI